MNMQLRNNIGSLVSGTQCLFMKKINYHIASLKEVSRFKELGQRPSLLLHACCAPCSSHTLNFLCQFFDVTILYYNSNIFPLAEYTKRRDEIEWFVSEYNNRESKDVKILFPEYNHEEFMRDLRPLANEKERGPRCLLCYEKRVEEALRYGEKHGFDYATTTLTVSRQKDSQIINQIAQKIAVKYPKIKYFYSDFKKDGGLDKVKEMKARYNLYQQEYCGCEYSLRDRVLAGKPDLDD